MVTEPKPRPPGYRRCVICEQLIKLDFDAHMGPCTNGKAHVLYSPTPYLTWPKEAQNAEPT